MQRPREVLIVTGPPGSGKTTVARLLAGSREQAAHLESDCFFHFVVSGYIEPWKPDSHEQNITVMRVVGEAAAGYARAGYFTVIDGIVSPRWFFPPLRESLAAERLRTSYVILRPDLPTAIERAERRQATRPVKRRVIEQLWYDFSDLGDSLERHVIDSSDQTAEGTVAVIEERLELGTLIVP